MEIQPKQTEEMTELILPIEKPLAVGLGKGLASYFAKPLHEIQTKLADAEQIADPDTKELLDIMKQSITEGNAVIDAMQTADEFVVRPYGFPKEGGGWDFDWKEGISTEVLQLQQGDRMLGSVTKPFTAAASHRISNKFAVIAFAETIASDRYSAPENVKQAVSQMIAPFYKIQEKFADLNRAEDIIIHTDEKGETSMELKYSEKPDTDTSK